MSEDSQTVTLIYKGPPAFIVELDREVGHDGEEEIEEVEAGLAGRLLHASGFTLADGHDIDEEFKPAPEADPPPESGQRIEDLEREMAVNAGEAPAEPEPESQDGDAEAKAIEGQIAAINEAGENALADLRKIAADDNQLEPIREAAAARVKALEEAKSK